MSDTSLNVAKLEANAHEVVDVLKAIGNARRLMILCMLVSEGEIRVNEIAQGVGLSQSACSQHLARMRDEGVVTFRRDGQALWYRISEPRVEALLATLYRLYCKE